MKQHPLRRDFITVADLSAEEILSVFELAQDLKKKLKNRETHHLLPGKTLALLFEKPSNRTRVSFAVGMWQLGGLAIDLPADQVQTGQRESPLDVIRTLSRYVDGIVVRTFAHEDLVKMSEASCVPIINGLTDLLHPCQIMADLFTVWEKKGSDFKNLKIAYVGDGNNIANSLLLGCAKLGLHLAVASPKGYQVKEEIYKLSQILAEHTGSRLVLTEDPAAAAADADFVYTDVWASMGQEAEAAKRKKIFLPYQLNQQLLAQAKPGALVLHCLPAHRGNEITDEVIDGPQSIVFDQAENRLHVQKAILAKILD